MKNYNEETIENMKKMAQEDPETYREMAFQSSKSGEGEKIITGMMRTKKIRIEALKKKIKIEGIEIKQETIGKGEKVENKAFEKEKYDEEEKIKYTTNTREGKQTKTEKMITDIKSGKKKEEIIKNNADMVLNKGVQFERIYKNNMKERTKKTKTIIYYGALDEHIEEIKKKYSEKEEEFYTVQQGRKGEVWFDGYDQEKITMVTEYNGNIDIRLITQMMGKGKLNVNVKGSTVKFNSEYLLIFCTSFKSMMLNWYPNASSAEMVNMMGKIDEAYIVDIEGNIKEKMESIKSAITKHKKIIGETETEDDEEVIEKSIKQVKIQNKNKMEKEQEKNELAVIKKEIKNANRMVENTKIIFGVEKTEKYMKEIEEMEGKGMEEEEVKKEMIKKNGISKIDETIMKSLVTAKMTAKKKQERLKEICTDKYKAKMEMEEINEEEEE